MARGPKGGAVAEPKGNGEGSHWAELCEYEDPFRAAFEHAAIGICIVDPETGKIVEANPRYCEITGYPPEELRGTDFLEITHAADRERNLDLYRRTASGQAPGFVIEKRYKRKDERVVWVRNSVALVRDAHGVPRRVVALVEDVTDRRAAMEDLKEARRMAEASAERLRTLAELSDQFGEAAPDLRKTLDRVASAAVRHLADACVIRLLSAEMDLLEPAAVVHRDADAQEELDAIVHQVPRSPRDPPYREVVERGQPVLIPILHEEAFGGSMAPYAPYLSRHPIHTAIFMPLIARGRVIGTLAVGREAPDRPYGEEDSAFLQALCERAALAIEVSRVHEGEVAARERLEQVVQERTRALVEANSALDAFAATAAHDLKAPLSSIALAAEILQLEDDVPPESRTRLMGSIEKQARRMAGLISDILHFSRATHVPLERADVDLCALARETVVELRVDDPAHAPAFECHGDLVARCDPCLTRIVLDNLLGNAWKFTKGCPSPRVELGAIPPSSPHGHPTYYVRDNGVGFPPESASKMFQPFERLHHRQEYPGTGLGLATVKRIVERHGGRVWAESAPDEGATIYFTLAP